MVAFLLIDVLLVVAALSSTGSETGEPTITPTIEPASPEPSPSDTDDPETSAAQVTSSRLLAAASEATAWRASAGSCDSAEPIVERTIDGGESWRMLDVSKDGVRQILALDSDSENYVEMVALVGEACEITDLRSFTSGDFWEVFDAGAQRLTYIDPANSAQIIVAGEALTTPCEFRQIVGAPDLAGMCAGTVQVQTQDDEWERIDMEGALALVGDANTLVAATIGSENCDGIGLVTFGDGTVEQDGCLVTQFEPDMVVAALAGEALWLWSGDDVLVSADYKAVSL